MPTRIGWGNPEQTLIRIDFEGAWTWADYDNAFEEAHRLAREVQHTVYFLANALKAEPLRDYSALPHIRRVWETRPPNLGCWVVVMDNPFLERMSRLVADVLASSKNVVRFARTEEEGHALIAQAQADAAQPPSGSPI